MRSANFVQETTTSIAGTLGDGAVTTTAIALSPRVSDALGASKRWVRYVIEKVSTGQREEGLGTFAANVLTRSRPQVTWTGTVWADGRGGAVVALQFGSAPTAGDVIIRLAATAEGQAPVVNARQSTVAGDSSWRDYPISTQTSWSGSGSTAPLTVDTEYYHAIKVDAAGLLNGIQIDVAVAAGALMKCALYDLGSDGLPGAKIVDFAGFSTASTGIKTDTATASWLPPAPVWIVPGWYVIGFIADGAFSIRGGLGNGISQQTPFGRRNTYGYSSTLIITGKSAATGLPASPNMTGAIMADPGGTALCAPWIGLKVIA
jgi:hypothetical protein